MKQKRMLRIYTKIMQIAQKGINSYMDYYNYIDTIVNNGEYSILRDAYMLYFNIDIHRYNSITSFKKNTFNLVRFDTVSIFQSRFYEYCNQYNVYQIGKYFYDSYNNEQLGEFTLVQRVNTVNYLGITYSYAPDPAYYRNTDLYRKLDEPSAIILQVLLGSDPAGVTLYFDNQTMTLLDKYKLGVNAMITGNPSINQYCINNYIDNYFE